MIIKRTLRLSLSASVLLAALLILVMPPAMAAPKPILVMGDSISAAYGMSLEQGWVALLAKELDKTHPGTPVINASISGESTVGALQRLPPLLDQHQPGIVIIELGGNDGLRGYPLIQLRSNLLEMTKLAQASGAQVIIVPMEIPPNYGNRYTEGFRESYRIVASNTDSTLATFLLEGVATDPQLMQADGIHPKVEAQHILMSNFMPSIKELLP
ncbi:MAG: arylesterase [Halioglobus sp.]